MVIGYDRSFVCRVCGGFTAVLRVRGMLYGVGCGKEVGVALEQEWV